MLQSIKNIFTLVKKVYAIDIEIVADGAYHCNAVELTKQKGDIDFTPLAYDEAEPHRSISAKDPVCLFINGKGIIHRRIAADKSVSDAELIKQILPNADADHFYMERYIADDEKGIQFISLARKDVIDKIITTFSANYNFIVNISISPFIVNDLLSVAITGKLLHYKNITIETEQERINGFSIQPENETQFITVGSKNINTALLPALAMGFSFLVNPSETGIETSVSENNSEFIYKQKILLTGKVFLCSLLVLLLINFLLFDHFYTKVKDKQPLVDQQEETVNKLQELNKTFASKSHFLEQAGLLEQNKTSFYLDRIASTIVDDIMLTDMQINPIASHNKMDNTYTFSNDIILISGISNRSNGFNNWIKELKKYPIIKNVSILSYDHEIKSGTALFTVEITISQDDEAKL